MSKMLRIIGCVAALFVSTAVSVFVVSPMSVTVRNESSQTVTQARFQWEGRVLDFPDIAPGQSARVWCRGPISEAGDGDYTFEALGSDGTRLRQDEGTCYPGLFHTAAQFVITSSGEVTLSMDNH